jgi:HD-like signal output (HDOD) protein
MPPISLVKREKRPPPRELPELPPDLAGRLAVLPRLAGVVGEFLALSRREYLTARQFESVLARDPALRNWLLRQANSSFFRPARPIAKLGEALVLIGLERLQRMVYAVAARDLYDERLHCYRFADQGFWLHAMGVGIVARNLVEPTTTGSAARPRREPPPLNAEEAFVAGLVHDAGKRLLDEILPRRGGRRRISRAEERACGGMDHALLSAHIARSWQLPDAVVTAVADHHAADRRRRRDGAAVVGLADAICGAWGIGYRTYPRTDLAISTRPWRRLLDALGWDDQAWDRLLAYLRPTLDGLAEMLRICVSNPVVELPPADPARLNDDRRPAPSAGADRRSVRRRERRRRDRNPHRAGRGTPAPRRRRRS